MELYEKLSAQAAKLSLIEFVRQHNKLYVVGRIPDDGVAHGFSTHVSGPTLEFPRSSPRTQVHHFVDVIAKSDRNDWTKRICVGRASNNDIIIRHQSVSKLHAYFMVQVSRERLKRVERLVLVDADSKNGTLINGNTIQPESKATKAVPLTVGDRLSFGEVDCEFLDAQSLFQRLERSSAIDF